MTISNLRIASYFQQKYHIETEAEMVGWHHRLNGHEFEQAPGGSEGQEGLRAAVHGVTKSRTQLDNDSHAKRL